VALAFDEASGAFPLRARTGSELLVLLPKGETVRDFTIDDDGIWRVTQTAGHDGLTLYALRPAQGSKLTVHALRRDYRLVLAADAETAAPYVVRIAAGGEQQGRAGVAPAPSAPGYRLSGDRSVLPTSIADDGEKVYIEWAEDQPIPAVLSLDRSGREAMTDGYMRDGRFVLDRIYPRLLFRIDGAEARAERLASKAGTR
jgi:type IV secretion system protein VirB9